MKLAQPQHLRLRRVQLLLNATRQVSGAAARVESISHRFLGSPYTANSLIGSADTPEVFTASLQAFDCVTYIETVLALAYAQSADRFASTLRRIRYDEGKVDWHRRNHYMTNWIRNNLRSGWVRRINIAGPKNRKERMLDAVPGLPPQHQRFTCIPKLALSKSKDSIRSGDLIFFASTRLHHDVFHCGIVIRKGEKLLLRHASRSQGGVVEEELSAFFKKHRMAGVLMVRPLDGSPR